MWVNLAAIPMVLLLRVPKDLHEASAPATEA
jgi:hypothetical protein